MGIAEQIAQSADGLAFGIVGGGLSLAVADAVERSGRRFHTTRFEGSAALMAGATGRLTGQLSLAVAIKGPGFANLAAGLATCQLEDFPLLAVAEAYGAGTASSKAHKRLDQASLASAVTKARAGIDVPDCLAALRALAFAERPGPVLLELEATGSTIRTVAGAPADQVGELLRCIDRAQRPAVIAGSWAARQGLSASLNQLSVPVFSTASAKGVVDERRPHAAGVFTGAGLTLAPECQVLNEADLVVGLGLRSHEVLTAGLPVRCVNIDDLELAPGFTVVARAGSGAWPSVLGALRNKPGWGAELIGELKARLRSVLLAGPFLPAQVYARAAEHLQDARLVLDTGFFCTIGEHVWEISDPSLYLSSGQGRSMGASLPMAIGAAMARPQQPTVLAIGDGGIGMFFTELTLAIAERLPLLILLMRDGTQASVRSRAMATDRCERPFVSATPDWTAVAAGLGLWAERFDNLADFASFVRRWRISAGPALVEICFDPEPYRLMTQALRA